MKHILPELSYNYDSLEPYIDQETLMIHHTRHHQGYVNKLNAALEKHPNLTEKPLEDLLMNLDEVPEDIRTAVRNNGGGHYAHSLFWRIMDPKPQKEPTGVIANLIESEFETYEKFKELFSKKAGSLFGSGWTWLILENDDLKIVQTSGHDVPISDNQKPLLVLDVWEHAYYLKYKNERGKFIENWWNILDWSKIQV